MLGARLATAAVAIPLLIAIIFGGSPFWLSILIVVLGSVAIFEFMAMAFPEQAQERILGVVCGVAVVVVAAGSQAPGLPLMAAFSAAIGVLLSAVVLRPVDLRAGLQDCAVAWFGIAYVTILAHFVWLRHLPDGPYWIGFVVANGMASDTGAYFAGRAFGNRKLLPRVSPGKTVAGAVGNLAAAALVGALAHFFVFASHALATLIVLAVVIAAVGQLGDLCESAIKRAFGSKESGSIFPGHGGVLDRIDSLLFPVAILYYYRVLA